MNFFWLKSLHATFGPPQNEISENSFKNCITKLLKLQSQTIEAQKFPQKSEITENHPTGKPQN